MCLLLLLLPVAVQTPGFVLHQQWVVIVVVAARSQHLALADLENEQMKAFFLNSFGASEPELLFK